MNTYYRTLVKEIRDNNDNILLNIGDRVLTSDILENKKNEKVIWVFCHKGWFQVDFYYFSDKNVEKFT